MTLQQAAQSALDVQNACNLSGVVRSFAEITAWMRADLGLDTPGCNRHPICRLFAEQVAHLVGMGTDDPDSWSKAYLECQRLAAGGAR